MVTLKIHVWGILIMVLTLSFTTEEYWCMVVLKVLFRRHRFCSKGTLMET